MAVTRTGAFPIGFRRTWGDWQKSLGDLITFATDNDFACVDVGALPDDELKRILDAGLNVGSVDLLQWAGLLSADKAARQAAVDANVQLIERVTALGIHRFFIVLLPEDPASDRKANHEHAIASFREIAQATASLNPRIGLEGWPGPGPYYPALGCTPESCRALFQGVDSPILGVNYDPSHLLRMGIDPLAFLDEFSQRIVHVHAKDTQILSKGLYEHGNLQPAAFASAHGFGGHHWRYTIPGQGQVPWVCMVRRLMNHDYAGFISIELEDERFFGSEEDQREGFVRSRQYLESI